MSAALAAAGWTLAAGALAVALVTRRELDSRMESLARAAHELRRPLTAAGLAAHGLAHANGDRPMRAATIERELACAGRLLEDLDAVRGVAAARPEQPLGVADAHWPITTEDGERPRVVVVPELLARVAASWEPVAEAHGRWIVVDPWDDVAILHGDAERLAQALGNLVANALEHGAGTVRLRGRREAGRVRVEVADGGAGLRRPVDELAGGARAGRGRRGRGLAIAGEIARAHGGRLRAAPRNEGARLILDLPAAATRL